MICMIAFRIGGHQNRIVWDHGEQCHGSCGCINLRFALPNVHNCYHFPQATYGPRAASSFSLELRPQGASTSPPASQDREELHNRRLSSPPSPGVNYMTQFSTPICVTDVYPFLLSSMVSGQCVIEVLQLPVSPQCMPLFVTAKEM